MSALFGLCVSVSVCASVCVPVLQGLSRSHIYKSQRDGGTDMHRNRGKQPWSVKHDWESVNMSVYINKWPQRLQSW